jgi:hypothetical protein
LSGYTLNQTECLYSYGGASTNLATFTTEDNLLKTYPLAELAGSVFGGLNAKLGQQSTTLKIRAGGQVGATATPTYTFSLRVFTTATWSVGGILLGSTNAMTAVSGVTLGSWTLDGDITLRTHPVAGATTATVVAMGAVAGNGFSSPGSFPVAGSSPAVSTWDTAAQYYFFLSCACSASSASNLVNCQYLKIYGDN